MRLTKVALLLEKMIDTAGKMHYTESAKGISVGVLFNRRQTAVVFALPSTDSLSKNLWRAQEQRLFVLGGYMETKRCTKCGEVKAISEFYVQLTCRDGRRNHCKSCIALRKQKHYIAHRDEELERQRKYASTHQEEVKESRIVHRNEKRERRLKRVYGLSSEDFNTMFLAQHGRCAICGRDNFGKRLHIDHNHETGKVRELLCNKCNVAIGLFGEDSSLIFKAAQYLKKWESA